jgi:hypothetical protein
MNDVTLVANAVTHQLYGTGLATIGRRRSDREAEPVPDVAATRDRGAVSLEQVLWFVAAGVSVAVIAAILWGQIKDKADDPIISPSSP